MKNELQKLAESTFKDYESAVDTPGVSGLNARDPNGAWWTFASAMMLSSVSGSLWAFGGYSNSFRSPYPYNFSQTSLQSLALFATTGNYLILDSGIIISKFGTVVGLTYGCSLIFLGYTALWICIAVVYSEVPFAVFACCFAVIGHGCGSLDNALFTELMTCFPNQTGYVVGCLKGFYGLSPGFLTMLACCLFDVTPHNFVLFLSVYSCIIGITLIPVVHATSCAVNESSSRIHGKLMSVSFGVVVAALAIFALAITDMQPLAYKPIWILALVCVILGVGSLFLVLVRPSAQAEEVREAVRPSIVIVEASWQDMIMSNEFFILFVIYVAGIGAGVMFMSNSGQILPAFEGPKASLRIPSFVAMLSCLNSLGRLTSGFVSEMLKSKIARPWFLVLWLGLQMAAFLLLIVVGPPILWEAGGVVSFTWGAIWSLLPLLLREVWGPRDFSMKFAFGLLPGLFGSLLFATLIAGRLFDREAQARHEAPFCFAASCFNTSFVFAALCDFVALLLALLLCRWTTWIYRPEEDSHEDRLHSS